MKKLIILLLPLFLLGGTTYAVSPTPVNCKVDDMVCYNKFITNYVSKNDVPKVLSTFENIAKTTNGLNGQCNNYGRLIGELVYKKYKAKALQFHASTCGKSFAYGLLATLGKDLGKASLEPALEYCAKDDNLNACAYGVGSAMAQAKISAVEIDALCKKSYKLNTTISYEDSSQGICVLGWVSAMSDLSKPDQFKSIKSSLTLCKGMSAQALDACKGEASFTYTYRDNPTSEVRLSRVNELAKNCTSSSEICARFVGKALNDYLLYSWKPDLNKAENVTTLSKLITKLCSSKASESCLKGFLNANSGHTTHESSVKICSYLTGALKNNCLKIVG